MQTANKLREGLPPLPDRIKTLPVDERGYPVPWFVTWIDGKPEFRAADARKIPRAINEKLCWICGGRMGKYLSFVIGPMCALNRISSEPPSHLDCARFAAEACPFLVKPQMTRRTDNMPHGGKEPEGFIPRNPGVTLIWTTLTYSLIPVETGVLFKIGEPTGLLCFARGRLATRDEIKHSIETGLPTLMKETRDIDERADLLNRRLVAYKLLGITP